MTIWATACVVLHKVWGVTEVKFVFIGPTLHSLSGKRRLKYETRRNLSNIHELIKLILTLIAHKLKHVKLYQDIYQQKHCQKNTYKKRSTFDRLNSSRHRETRTQCLNTSATLTVAQIYDKLHMVQVLTHVQFLFNSARPCNYVNTSNVDAPSHKRKQRKQIGNRTFTRKKIHHAEIESAQEFILSNYRQRLSHQLINLPSSIIYFIIHWTI